MDNSGGVNSDRSAVRDGSRERFVGTVVRVAGLVLATLLAQSFFWSPANPVALKIVVAGFALLAAATPEVALLALAAAVPFGRVISTLTSPSEPVGITEALALAYLAGWASSRLRKPVREGPASAGLLFAYGFAAVVVASVLVDIGILRYWRDYWQPFVGQLITYFARDYLNITIEPRPWASSLGGLASATAAARVIEGLGLMRAAQTLSAKNAAFGRRLLWTLAVAAVGTAILSVQAAMQLAETQGVDLLSVLHVHRIAVNVTKVNTASSYFVLFVPVLIGLAARSARFGGPRSPAKVLRLTVTAAGTMLLLMGFWLAGGRAAMMAGLVVAFGVLLEAVSRRHTGRLNRRSAVAVLAACGVVVAVLGFGLYLKAERVEGAGAIDLSLKIRLAMWRSTIPVLAAHPLFGTGIGQFRSHADAFVPDEAARAYLGGGLTSAHNQFLEMAAEVGVIGGLLFVGMFAAILWRAWKAFRANHDPMLGGAIAGVVAFLITCLAGQPLFYNVVAFPVLDGAGRAARGGRRGAATTGRLHGLPPAAGSGRASSRCC